MANGHGNCIFGVCCPPESESQVEALAGEIDAATGGALSKGKDEDSEGWAWGIARWILKTYDLAPKGSLQAFKDSIRDYAREGYVPVEKMDGTPGNSAAAE